MIIRRKGTGGTNFTNSNYWSPSTGNLTNAFKNIGVGIGTFSALTTGDNNVCVGHQSGNAINTGSENTLLGLNTGDSGTISVSNTMIGARAGAVKTNYTNEIYIGHKAGSVAAVANSTRYVVVLRIYVLETRQHIKQQEGQEEIQMYI